MAKINSKYIGIAFLLVAVLAVVLVFVFSPSSNNKNKHPLPKYEEPKEPVFRKDGELSFLAKNKSLKTISIEIAEKEAERTQGLMYRKSMPDSCGMLFVFEDMQPLSFWMKNTQFPLDIIYIDKDFKIVSISKNTVPFSEKSIPSAKAAMYVVEVNAGFCDKYAIVEGNKIMYTLK